MKLCGRLGFRKKCQGKNGVIERQSRAWNFSKKYHFKRFCSEISNNALNRWPRGEKWNPFKWTPLKIFSRCNGTPDFIMKTCAQALRIPIRGTHSWIHFNILRRLNFPKLSSCIECFHDNVIPERNSKSSFRKNVWLCSKLMSKRESLEFSQSGSVNVKRRV